MRRGVVFGLLAAPAVVWAGVASWAQWMARGWTPGQGELAFSIRVGLATSQCAIRLAPFAVVAGGLVWPLLIPAIAALAEGPSPRSCARPKDVLIWWSVSAAVVATIMVIGGIALNGTWSLEPSMPMLAGLGWIGVAAFLVSMAAAYSVQRRRYAAHQSTWRPRTVLAGLLAINCLGLLALPLLAAFAFRAGDAGNGRAVEQGDEADQR